MADCKDEKLTTEESSDNTELQCNGDGKCFTITNEINNENTGPSNDQENSEKNEENGVESYSEFPKISSNHSDCISSEENSPIKTGFLRSFIEKKHNISQGSESSENGQFKTE